jgi:aminodeoxyfutalosine synthase
MYVYSPAISVAYSRLYAHRDEGWELSQQQMLDMVKKYDGQP